jgi:DNA-binding NarL/FixJ family response regulator
LRTRETGKWLEVAILQRRPLDRAALAALFRQQYGIRLIGLPESEWEAISVCRANRPDATIIDTSLPGGRVLALANILLRNGFTNGVVLLGDEPDAVWTAKAVKLPHAIYTSRADSFEVLLHSIEQCCGTGLSIGQVAEQFRATLTQSGKGAFTSPHFSTLTPREQEILRLLAEGNSVRQCAVLLGRALSTVDNHKARIMRKLKIRKSVDLVRLAIRERLVLP